MIELQRKLMGDTVRNHAFEMALRSAVKKGDTVIDLGSGTGFLGFLASRLGASQVICIESGEIADVAKKLAKRNGIKNCTFIRKHSTEIKSVSKADVLVSETLGNYALEENILESMEDAKRFLKPNGVLIPSRIDQYVCPVTSDRVYKTIDVWPQVGFDLKFDEAREISLHNMYVKTVKKEDLLAEKDAVRRWDTVDFSKKNQSVRTANIRWTLSKAVTLYGFALWWTAELAKGVELSTSPTSPATHWEQIFLPLLTPVAVTSGSIVELTVTSDTRYVVKINLQWTLKVLDASGKERSTQTLDMTKGYVS